MNAENFLGHGLAGHSHRNMGACFVYILMWCLALGPGGASLEVAQFDKGQDNYLANLYN
jgi:hypothetical protein